MNVYIPNGESPDSPKFVFKLAFIATLRDYLCQYHTPETPLLMAGDFNVAPEASDVHAPEAWENEPIFCSEARQAILRLQSWGMEDLFRRFHPQGGEYSWWDYRMAAFRRNLGLRVDHLWATPPLSTTCGACDIDKLPRAEEKPSDHAPVIALFSPTHGNAAHGNVLRTPTDDGGLFSDVTKLREKR